MPGGTYVSTACQHGRHEECRLTCKFCPALCACTALECHWEISTFIPAMSEHREKEESNG